MRREYLELVERLLPTAGCRDPRRHAPQLLALLDGLVLNQLLQPATELSDEALVDLLERFFSAC